jgi:hypothetical protein
MDRRAYWQLLPWRQPAKPRPSVLLMPDKRGWIFDSVAQSLARLLGDEFDFSIHYAQDRKAFDASAFDLTYFFFWGEPLYREMNIPYHRLVKHVASHRWEDDPRYGPHSAQGFVETYLHDAGAVHCTSRRLYDLIAPHHPNVHCLANGIDPRRFYRKRRRHGPLVVGWAGNASDAVKETASVLQPACEGAFDLRMAGGKVPAAHMNTFYNSLDVIAVTSRHEGHPMPLLEGMAAGCFPVTTDVGIVPEVIRHGENGYIVEERSADAFRAAFAWCAANQDHVRAAGAGNAEHARQHFTWRAREEAHRSLFRSILRRSRLPRFRNDDVSVDTPMQPFTEFCRIFWEHGFTQVHGVTLRGRTCDFSRCGSEPAPYEGIPPLSKLSNATIRELSEPHRIEDNAALVDFLNASPDELALHGFSHCDYSNMAEPEIRSDIAAGLALMRQLFPRKLVRYFVAPFNRTSDALRRVCGEFRLELLGAQGVHFEQRISDIVIEADTWYRYHHHRFYPHSTCAYYPTTLATLDQALARRTSALDVELRRLAA